MVYDSHSQMQGNRIAFQSFPIPVDLGSRASICSRLRCSTTAAKLLSLAVALAAVRAIAADDQPAARTDNVPTVLTITGVVKDAFVGRPISGAKVTVYQDVGTGGEQKVKRSDLVTDGSGRYTFQWRTDDPANPPRSQQGSASDVFSLQIKAGHADYLPDTIAAQIALAEPAEFSRGRVDGFAQRRISDDPALRHVSAIELRPGKTVTGLIQSTGGQPLSGVKVVAESQLPKKESEVASRVPGGTIVTATDDVVTDEKGRFEVTMITPGIGLLSIAPEKDFAPKKLVIYDQRGDVGVIKLEQGAAVRGRVVDVDGKPQAGVQVAINPWNSADPPIPFAEAEISATAMTDTGGNFAIGRLPAGEYRLEPTPYYGGRQMNADGQFVNDFRPVPGIFVPQRLKLVDGQDASPAELRAVPTVSIEGRVTLDLNPPGAGAAGAVQFGGGRGGFGRGAVSNQGPTVQGKFADLPYRATIRATDPDGSFKVDVPKGLSDAVIEVDLSSPFPGARGRGLVGMQGHWRLGKDGPLQSTSRIRLGTLEKDFRDLEIVYTRDANPNISSPAALLDAQMQSLQAAVQSGRISAEQAAEMQQALLQRQQEIGPANAGQPAQQPPAAGRGRATGRATATGRSGRAATPRGAQPADDNN